MYSMTESMIAASTWFILDHKEWRSFPQVEANKENTCKEKSVFLEQENTSGSEVIPRPPTPCLFIFSCIKMCSRFVSRACCELKPRCFFLSSDLERFLHPDFAGWKISHDFRIISRHTANLFSSLIFDPSRSHHLPPPPPLGFSLCILHNPSGRDSSGDSMMQATGSVRPPTAAWMAAAATLGGRVAGGCWGEMWISLHRSTQKLAESCFACFG